MKKLTFTLLITLAAACLFSVPCNAKGKAKHVVFIGLDGWGAYSVPKAEIPHIKQLMANGSYTLEKRTVMSPMNVHANWFPVNGEVVYATHHPGRFMAAYLPKSSTENERSTVVIRTPQGQLVLMRQVAGAMARRIVTYACPGDEASVEDHMGFIKFGSRVDLYLPLSTTIDVKLGDATVGGVTQVGTLHPEKG